MPIKAARIYFDPSGTPVSSRFEDFYFSTDDGLEESRYVFLKGNGLPGRWLSHPREHFVIAETGFGSGLNFLASWDSFNHSQKSNQHRVKRLHFISFEKYPLTADDVATAVAHWPQLASLSRQLVEQYPPLMSGCHRLSFDQGRVVLDLWFGDIKDNLPQLFRRRSGEVDAWYLDGFSPAKNADMWCRPVYQEMMALSKAGASVATFTAAGQVRKDLQAAGFTIKKIPGFGKKREMLTATVTEKPAAVILPPFHYRHESRHQSRHNGNKNVAIIGGGIAAATLCYALAKRGYAITVYCKDPALAQGASQNRQGALYPLLHAGYDSLSEFYAHAYGYALRLYRDLDKHFGFTHSFCGVLLQGFNDKVKQRQQSLIDSQLWPSSLLRPVDQHQASEIAGITLPQSGIYYPDGGWINPASLIDALIGASRQLGKVDVRLNTRVGELTRHEHQGWQLLSTPAAGPTTAEPTMTSRFDQAVICSGHLAGSFEQTQALALAPIRGQVSHLPATGATEKLKTVLCYNGYLTPAMEQLHCLGASFVKGDAATELREREHSKNLERLKQCLPGQSWVEQLPQPTGGKASVRCASIDHLPLVGAVPDYQAYRHSYRDLWKGLKPDHYPLPPDYPDLMIFTALGARGLCSAPLAAEILAAQINNEPYPASQRVLNALNPGRGYIKALKSKDG